MQESLFFEKLDGSVVKCLLCPRFCVLKTGQTGACKVRENREGLLVTHVYNRVAAMGIDPIEKKPLYHFYPGKDILSIGEVGCNLHCTFCQNHRISHCYATEFYGFQPVTSEQIVKKALHVQNNIGIAYTYNEPFTFFEFMYDTARLAHQNGLKNVVVSNGYVNPDPLHLILPFLDAFNIDLKAFDNAFYKRQTKGTLEPVLESLKMIARSGKHLEITWLVIPGLNDDEKQFEEMALWIAEELGSSVPLHLSRYFPQYKLTLPPTPLETLNRLHSIASRHLHFVYLGNVNDEKHASTFCPHCHSLVIERNRYFTKIIQTGFHGSCIRCGAPVGVIMDT